MESTRLLVYKASAGSGKTFTLASRYISHLAEDPNAYRKILAVTFTNKATAEMKERIIGQLRGIASANPASDGLLRMVMKNVSMTEDEVRNAAQTALTGIVHDYSRFRIETIDSFFQSIIRNLARELELGTSLNVDLDNESALNDAVDEMVSLIPVNRSMLVWLLEYIEEQIAEDKTWRIIGGIKKFGKNIFDETYIENGEQLRKKLCQPQFTADLKRNLQTMRRKALATMKRHADSYFEALERNGLETKDVKVSTYFKEVRQGNLTDDIFKTTIANCIEDGSEQKWCTKKNPKRNLIYELAASELIPLLQQTERERPKNNYIACSCKLILEHLNELHLLNDIAAEVNLQSRQKNRFLLSDTNALLHRLIREGDASFVFEKIGTTVDIVMIDEFQDTSRMQWENFRLLLDECIARRNGSLVVGDIKQSIYRWRNGDWRILANLEHGQGAFRVQTCSLDTNWRSEMRIVDFNNRFFTAACEVLNSIHRNDYGRDFDELKAAYSDVCQRSSKEDAKGYVSVSFLKGKADECRDLQLKFLMQRVLDLIEQGVKPKDITILVRNKKTNIPLIAKYFKDNAVPHPIVSDEAFRLDASPAVCIMIDALRWLSCPADSISLARLKINYQRCAVRSGCSVERVLTDDSEESFLPRAFSEQKEMLKQLPLFELLTAIYDMFQLSQIEGQDAYVCSFFDNVMEYARSDTPDLPAFIKQWDEKLCSKTIPSGEIDGIRIMSIHKSKGLEFHTVLIPFCDWQMEVEVRPHTIWCCPDENKDDVEGVDLFSMLDILPVDYSDKMQQTVFRNSYIAEKNQLWIDNLNLLYVAFTRASKNLIVWGRIQGDGLKTTANLMHRALKSMGAELTEKEKTYSVGDVILSEEDAPRNDSTCILPSVNTGGSQRYEFRQSNRSAAFVNPEEASERDKYISKGLLLHSVFASISQASELEASLTRLRFEGVIESEDQEREIRELASWALRNPHVRDWYDGSWQVVNERSIIFKDPEGNVLTRRPDRVMMRDGTTVVVDFKFGAEHEEHFSQVREYMSLFSQMGHADVKGYLWYVYSNKVLTVTL